MLNYLFYNDKKNNKAQSEYKHVRANILRSRYVARTPPLEARSPGRRSNIENAPLDGQLPASQHTHFPYTARNFENAPLSPAGHQPAARAHPTERLYYVVISRDGRKLVTRVRVVLP